VDQRSREEKLLKEEGIKGSCIWEAGKKTGRERPTALYFKLPQKKKKTKKKKKKKKKKKTKLTQRKFLDLHPGT